MNHFQVRIKSNDNKNGHKKFRYSSGKGIIARVKVYVAYHYYLSFARRAQQTYNAHNEWNKIHQIEKSAFEFDINSRKNND